MRHLFARVCGLLALALLAACGGGGDAAEPPTAHLPPPCPASAPAPCA